MTAANLAAALGITVADPESESDPGIVEAARLLSIADALVTAYLRGGTAPAAVRDESLIRTAGHARNRRTHAGGRIKAGGLWLDTVPSATSAVRVSGAAALLSPFVRRSA